MARTVTDRLRRGGVYERGYVGAILKVIDSDVAAKYGLRSTKGTVVDVVLPGTPAEKAGLKAGDVIEGVNGREIPSSYHLQEAVSSVGPSSPIILNIVRKGARVDVPVITALRPQAPRGDPLEELQGYLRVHFDEDPKHASVFIRDPRRSRRAPGLWDGSLLKSVLPAQDWPEEAITLNYYKTRARPAPIKSLSDLRKALERAYVGGRMAATFEIDHPPAPITSVDFDVLWPIVM
jgi:membrane-associated protease RseP (regulator of RpoE activity)